VNPKERFNFDKIINHPWFKDDKKKKINMPEVTDKIRAFNARRRFKKASLSVLAVSRLNAITGSKKK